MRRGAARRNQWGIPHMWGDTVEDLAYVQGFTAVTDRAWQVQTEKWRSEGRLAERLGPAHVPWDRFARRARLDDTARRCFQRLLPETRRWIEAYVDGVNDALPHADAPEFGAAGCAPDPWRPWSPLGVFLVQHILFSTFPNKLWRAHVSATLGPGAGDLFAMEGPAGAGSNAWAVAGDPGAGRPTVIAGDPHRVLELPGIYQQVRLSCPEFDVAGLAFPGVPGVPHFGHAGPVAWAVTNAMADYQDLYRERLRRRDGRIEVREADGWTAVPHHVERIAVRGGDPVEVEIIETARGPVIDVDRTTGEAISLRTPTRVDGDLGFDALLPLLRARRAGDVAEALRDWVEPVNSVLVADDTGTVLRLVAGRVPIRDDRCRDEPVPGWDPRYRWHAGYAPMPSAVVPDVEVHANDRRAGDNAELGRDFAPPHRARRIRALLADGAPAGTVHTDTLADHAALLSLLRRLPARRLSPAGAILRDRLLAWSGRMDADSADAGAFAAWRAALARRLAEEPALRPLRAPSAFDELFAPWTDPATRVGLALDGLVTGLPRLGGDPLPPAAAALDEVAAGPEPDAWGERHLLHPVHLGADPAVGAAVAALRARVRLAGDNDAVLATDSVPGVSDVCRRGPVARYVWQVGDRAASRWIVPFGSSGRAGDPHFLDQSAHWAAGDLIPLEGDPTMAVVVYEEDLPGMGRLSLTVLNPQTDAELVHGWVTQPRATFWGMLDHSVEQVREIYELVDGLPTHHAFLIRLDDRPIGLFQSYEPDADPVGERYDVRSGDVGMHLLLAPGQQPPHGLTGAVVPALLRFLFRDPEARRLVVEPDARNERALNRLKITGFTFEGEIDMPTKRAQLAFLTRERFTALFGDHPDAR
ncbi:hypothetical protein GCM10027187_33310 [Streptosporangium sandarakinum]|nr:GNAT family N-acetyltransferase [Streptosporangium sandarakinum]